MPRRLWKGRDKLTAREADRLARAASQLEQDLADRNAVLAARVYRLERSAA